MRKFGCTHTVEAELWNEFMRDQFERWFEGYGVELRTSGSWLILPTGDEVPQGDWVLFSHGEFIAIDHDSFTEVYAEIFPDGEAQ